MPFSIFLPSLMRNSIFKYRARFPAKRYGSADAFTNITILESIRIKLSLVGSFLEKLPATIIIPFIFLYVPCQKSFCAQRIALSFSNLGDPRTLTGFILIRRVFTNSSLYFGEKAKQLSPLSISLFSIVTAASIVSIDLVISALFLLFF